MVADPVPLISSRCDGTAIWAKLSHCEIGNRWLPRNTHAFKTVTPAPGIGEAMPVPERGEVAAPLREHHFRVDDVNVEPPAEDS